MKHELQITITGKAGTGRTSMALLIQKALADAGVKNVVFESEECHPNEFERITEMFEDGTKDAWKSQIEVTIKDEQLPRT